ncbi:Uncharacterised protein [Klebsiella pneumoniae]|uniref:Uncharacterized protein n=1 Tax=Klebsiella pneumoniae TaxID=573 RepID=A0A2X3IR93_KLEPN|nr:hypothetical protein D1220_11490 [Klebsiella pneumoniae]SQC86321.1 Uncharacterised protein [Klebsiella pneumoniae]
MVMVIKSNVPSNIIANPDGWNPPFSTEGLLYAGIYGRGSLTKNFAKNGIDAVINGAPVVNNHFAEFNANDFLDTGIVNTKEATLIVVAKRNINARRQFLVSSYTGDAKFGRSILIGYGDVQALTVYSHYQGQDANGADKSIPFSKAVKLGVQAGSPGFMYGKDTGKTISVKDITSNKSGSVTAAGTMESIVTAGLTYRIGRSHNNAEAQGDNAIAAALIFDRALSDAEIKSIYDYFQAYYARRGISI